MKVIKVCGLFVVLAAISSGSFGAGGISVGVKGGQTLISDLEDLGLFGLETDGSLAVGFSLGYALTETLHAEVDFISGGAEFSGPGGSLEADYDTVSVYSVFKSKGSLYFAGKIGITRATIDFSSIDSEESDSGLSAGFGGGYRVSKPFSLEVEFTIVDQDLSWFLVSARYTFSL